LRSIMQQGHNWDFCYLCGRNHTGDPFGLETHHVFGGANRKLSEKYGLKVHLCGERCHRNGLESVHKNNQVNLSLKAAGQKAFESQHGTHEDFMRIFGKNYI